MLIQKATEQNNSTASLDWEEGVTIIFVIKEAK